MLAKRFSLTGQSSGKCCSSRHRSDEGRGGDVVGEEEDDAVEGLAIGDPVATLEGLDCIEEDCLAGDPAGVCGW